MLGTSSNIEGVEQHKKMLRDIGYHQGTLGNVFVIFCLSFHHILFVAIFGGSRWLGLAWPRKGCFYLNY
jgi:hypothetical protein